LATEVKTKTGQKFTDLQLTTMFSVAQMKELAGFTAAQWVQDGMVIGAGTGSTASWFIKSLGERVRAGLQCKAVPTSLATEKMLRLEGITVRSLNELTQLDLVIDGADELTNALALIKGGGGALLQEKMVAFAGGRYLIIADETKLVKQLGKFPLPVEVVPYGYKMIQQTIEKEFGLPAVLRMLNDQPFSTDHHHYILDIHMQQIDNAASVQAFLAAVPGVVENGLFLNMATDALVTKSTGELLHLQRQKP
jgi:ribose 5-phosphate isomerase A